MRIVYKSTPVQSNLQFGCMEYMDLQSALKTSFLARPREEYCNIILDEAGKMNRLVRQLLNLNELESGQIEPDPSKFDLAEVLREESQLYMRSAAERQAAVLIQLPETLPVCTDLFLTEQILQNYLSNAVNHVSGGGSITVTAGAA